MSRGEEFQKTNAFSLYNNWSPTIHCNTIAPNLRGHKKFTILLEALLLINTLYVVHCLNTQDQRRRFIAFIIIYIFMYSLNCPSAGTTVAVNFTILVESSMLITIMQAV